MSLKNISNKLIQVEVDNNIYIILFFSNTKILLPAQKGNTGFNIRKHMTFLNSIFYTTQIFPSLV